MPCQDSKSSYSNSLNIVWEPTWVSGIGSISWLVWRGRGHATTCELYAKIIADSELLQPALNEIHKFCLQHWSRGRSTCGTGSSAPVGGSKIWYFLLQHAFLCTSCSSHKPSVPTLWLNISCVLTMPAINSMHPERNIDLEQRNISFPGFPQRVWEWGLYNYTH